MKQESVTLLKADLSEAAILEEQWQRLYGHRKHDTAEESLLWAILQEAIHDMTVLHAMKNQTHYQRVQTKEVERWFADTKRDDIGSFVYIWTHFFGDLSLDKARRYFLKFRRKK